MTNCPLCEKPLTECRCRETDLVYKQLIEKDKRITELENFIRCEIDHAEAFKDFTEGAEEFILRAKAVVETGK